MKPFIPNVLHAAKRRPLDELLACLRCCEQSEAAILEYIGQTVVIHMDRKPILGTTICHYCNNETEGLVGVHVYYDPGDPDVNYAEAVEVDIDEAPLTKEEYERICLANHNAATVARRGSN